MLSAVVPVAAVVCVAIEQSCTAELGVDVTHSIDRQADEEAPSAACSVANNRAPTNSNGQYLFVHCGPSFDTGFGDRMQWYYGMLATATTMNCTLVGPPIMFAEQNYSMLLPKRINSPPLRYMLKDAKKTRAFQELYILPDGRRH